MGKLALFEESKDLQKEKSIKTIRLLRLELRDFQGGTFVFEPQGKDSNVYGRNTSGKTRLVSAFTWLLFGKDALGRADFAIKNLNSDGEEEHNLEHTVEATLEVDSIVRTLKKVYQEKWTRKRGNAKAEFTGHEVKYFIDGVPMKEKEYMAQVSDIAGGEDTFRLLTSPTVFPNLHWTKQRALLLEVCGDLSDSDVIESNPKLSKLLGILGKRSIEDHRKVIASQKAEINKELEKIPIRIDECRRSMPEISGLNQKELDKEVKGLETQIADLKLKLRGVDTGGVMAELTKKLAVINADLQKMEGAHYSEVMQKVRKLDSQISEMSALVFFDDTRSKFISNSIVGNLKRSDGIEKELIALREKWALVDAEAFKDTTAAICPACGQSLPADRVHEAYEKALAAFNLDKATRLTDIGKRGTAYKEEKERLLLEIAQDEKERDTLLQALPVMKAEIEKLTIERDVLKKKIEDYTEIPGHTNLIMTKAETEDRIKEEQKGRVVDTDAERKQITEIEEILTDRKTDLNKFTQRANGEKRIDDLKAEEKKLATEFEKLEEELYLCDEFIKTKVNLLTENINSHFEFTRFKLFEVLINQGIQPTCEIMVNGVGFNSGLNSAARTQSGLDIIRTLQQHYGLSAPVFVDNRESVTDLPQMNCQVISLIVSEADKKLRVETVY
jgi:hypothetical protein